MSQQPIVELPILFANVDKSGNIKLESSVFMRKQGTRLYSRMPTLDSWMKRYRAINVAEYTEGSTNDFHQAVYDGIKSNGVIMFTTISLHKPSVDIDHSLGLIVNTRTGNVELFESRGADLSHKKHSGIRRNFYTQASFNQLQNTIVQKFFRKNSILRDANLEARMAGNALPFPTKYKPQPMLQIPVLMTIDSACRLGVLIYIYYRLKNRKASRYSVYQKVKSNTNKFCKVKAKS